MRLFMFMMVNSLFFFGNALNDVRYVNYPNRITIFCDAASNVCWDKDNETIYCPGHNVNISPRINVRERQLIFRNSQYDDCGVYTAYNANYEMTTSLIVYSDKVTYHSYENGHGGYANYTIIVAAKTPYSFNIECYAAATKTTISLSNSTTQINPFTKSYSYISDMTNASRECDGIITTMGGSRQMGFQSGQFTCAAWLKNAVRNSSSTTCLSPFNPTSDPTSSFTQRSTRRSTRRSTTNVPLTTEEIPTFIDELVLTNARESVYREIAVEQNSEEEKRMELTTFILWLVRNLKLW